MMENEIAEKIIEKLSQKTSASGRYVKLGSDKCSYFSIDRKNFREIASAESKSRIEFIDGGNSTIVDAASFCLQAARVYSAVYSANRRVKSAKKDFFVLASASKEGSEMTADLFGTDEKIESFSAFDSTLSTSAHRLCASAAAAACRRIIELRHAESAVKELEKGDIVVLDRDLEASITGEKEIFGRIYSEAEKRGVIICGISKTTRLFTDTGDSAAAAVSAISPGAEWYLPVAEADSDEHKAYVCFANLNRASRYIFRIDIYNKQKEHAEKVLSVLKKNASDPVFIGYPYGMVDADRNARISNEEAEYLKVKLMAKAGKKSSMILRYMRSLDAHSILDSIS